MTSSQPSKRTWHSLFFIIAILIISACSSTRPVSITETESQVGQTFVTEEDISAVTYEFSNRIHSAYLDSVSGLFTLQFRDFTDNEKWLKNSGRIVVFDPDSSRVVWDYNLPYNRRSYIQFGSNLFEYTQSGGHFINLESGRRDGKLKYYVYHVDPAHNVGMGYKIATLSRTPDTLYGFDMSTGEEIWKRDIKSDYDWNNVIFMDDTTTVLVAGGLHTLDPRDGSGWSYDSQTGKKDYTPAVVGTLAGIATGLLTGNYSVATGHTLIADLVSNILIDESTYTLATADEVIMLDRNGDTIWSQPLDKNEASQSYIWDDDNTVYLLNSGLANRNNRLVEFGDAFFAAFEKESGERLYKSYLGDDDEFVSGFDNYGDSVLLLFRNKIEKFHLGDGQVTETIETDSLNEGSLVSFVGIQAFRKEGEDVYYSITGMDESNNYIITDEERVIVLDNFFEHIDTIDIGELYYTKSFENDHLIISSYDDSHSILLDDQMMSIAEINAAGEVFSNGETLYLVDETKLVKLNMSDL